MVDIYVRAVVFCTEETGFDPSLQFLSRLSSPNNSGSHNVTEKLLRATMHQIPLYLNNGNYSYD